MPAAVAWAVASIGAAVGSAAMMMYAVEIASAIMVAGGLAYSQSKANAAKQAAKDKFNAAQVDRLVNISSAVSARDMVLGRVRKAGTVVYKATTDANNRRLYLVIALAGHEIDAVEQIYLNDVPVEVNANGSVTTAPYWCAADRLGQAWSYVEIATHLGQPGQTVDSMLNTAFPDEWPSTHTLDGVAYLAVMFVYDENVFPNGVPNVTAVVRGAKLYDPRTATHAWSENPALMMRALYTHPKVGKAASVTATEEARFIAAANACDTATVYTVGGVAQPARALYQAALVAPFGTPARSLFDDLCQAMGGSWAFAGGELYIKPGVYTAPVMTITDADLAVVKRDGASESQSPISISVHKERNSKINTVKPTIWDAATDYKQTALTPLVASALVARDGVELTQEVSYPAIGYAPQALHVAGIMLRDARDALVVDMPVKLSCYALELFDTVAVTLARYGWTAKTFMVLGRTWNMDGSIQLTLKETNASITQMDAGFSAQGFGSNTRLPDPWTVTPVGALTITSGSAEAFVQADGTVVPRMRVAWVQVPDAAVVANGSVEVQYRVFGTTNAWTSLGAPGAETSVVATDVKTGVTYAVRARAKTSLSVSAWSTEYSHTVAGKTAGIANYDNFDISFGSDGRRFVTFSYTGAAPVDLAGARMRSIAGFLTTPAWETMTPLHDGLLTASFDTDGGAAGDYTFALRAVDTSGNEAASPRYLQRTMPALTTAASAQSMALSVTGYAFIFADAAASTSTSPDLTFTANLQNLTGTASFTATAYNAANTSLGAITLGGTGNVRTLTAAQFTNNGTWATQYVKVVATLGTLTDTTTVYRGNSGTNAITMLLTNEDATVPANSAGTVSSWANATTAVKVYQGVEDVTGLWTFTATVSNAGGTFNAVALPVSTGFTGIGAPALVVNSLSAVSGSVTVTAARTGYASMSKTFTISKNLQGATGSASTVPGPTGSRGTIVTKITTAWTDTAGYNQIYAIASAAGMTPTYPIKGDIVSYTGGAKECSVAGNPGTWVDVAAYINGSMILTGTLGADKISAGTITAAVSINSTGYIKSDGSYTNAQYTSASHFNYGRGANYGVVSFAGAMSGGTGVLGYSDNDYTFGVQGGTQATTGVGVYAYRSTNGTALQVAGPATFDNAITSTRATGSAPLSVTSTTVCSNLNADMLDGNHASAFLSASGTAAAASKLTGVSGNSYKFNGYNLPASSSYLGTFVSNLPSTATRAMSSQWLELTIDSTVFWIPVWQK